MNHIKITSQITTVDVELEDEECNIVEVDKSQRSSAKENTNLKLGTSVNSTNDVAFIIDDDERDTDKLTHDNDNNCTINAQINVKDKAISVDDIESHDNVLLNKSTGSNQNKSKHTKCVNKTSDGDLIILDSNSNNNTESNVRDDTLIVLDEDSESENDCSIIDTATAQVQANKSIHKTSELSLYDELLRKDKALTEIVDKCLDIENSTGMSRIINRTLMPIYLNTSEKFKKSEYFQRMITKTLRKLETEPYRKYSHLKNFIEIMKNEPSSNKAVSKIPEQCEKPKKRAQLTTLKRQISGQPSGCITKSSDILSKKPRLDIISIDDDDDHNSHTQMNGPSNINNEIDKNNKTSDIECSNINQDTDSQSKKDDMDHSNKNNETHIHNVDDDIILVEDETDKHREKNTSVSEPPIGTGSTLMEYLLKPTQHLNHPKSQIKDHLHSKTSENEKENGEVNSKINDTNSATNNTKHSKSSDHVAVCLNYSLNPNAKRIEQLKGLLKKYKMKIDELEAKEVDWRQPVSPYIQSNELKKTVVKMYSELCRLNGTTPVKWPKVRLKGAEGRHPGPVEFLEQFINNNVDQEGNLPFPDLQDVVNCVEQAKDSYKLEWNKHRVLTEARALFIHYGRTAQKRRQHREWRHLMRYMKEEAEDPAEHDPELQARLEGNAKLALKNEDDLLERYALMENTNWKSAAKVRVEFESEHDTDSDETLLENNPNIVSSVAVAPSNSMSNIRAIEKEATPERSPDALDNIKIHNTTTNNVKDVCNELTSSNNVDSTVVQNINGCEKQIPGKFERILDSDDIETVNTENNERKQLPSNTLPIIDTIIGNVNYEDFDAVIETGIKLNYNETENNQSIQYNEVSTNSEIDGAIENDIKDEITIETNEVSSIFGACDASESEVNTELKIGNKVYYFENDRSEMDKNTKNIVSDSLKDKENRDNSLGLTNDKGLHWYKNCDPVNANLEMDNNNKELLNNRVIESDISIKAVNNRTLEDDQRSRNLLQKESLLVDGETCSAVNDTIEPETDSNAQERLNDTESVRKKCAGMVNPKQSINNRRKSLDPLNNSNPTKTTDTTGGNDKETPMIETSMIKKEKLDIPQLLDALGENYTVTIFDIEDTFEVIEISDSSSSSDSEDES